MKQIFLFLIFSLFISTGFSQGIQFEENHSLTDAIAKAKSENKMVFIDAYASWCGPCKMMAAQIFTQQNVGDYFNEHFVNLKLDMEKGDNVAIAKKYQVSAYPTYLFLNGDGELVHRALGSMPADDFINVAKTAGDSDNNTMALTKKVKSGDRSYEVIKKYLEINPYDKGNQALVEEYYAGLNEKDKMSDNAWGLFQKYMKNMDSQGYKNFLANKSIYQKSFGKEAVDSKIATDMVSVYMTNKEKFDSLKAIDEDAYKIAKQLIEVNDAYRAYYKNKDDKKGWENLIEKFDPYLLNTNNDPQSLNSISWMVFENYKKFNDKNALKKAVKWAEKATKLAPDNDAIKDTYANILFDLGKKKEAVKAETEALELAKKSNNAESVKAYIEVLEKFKK